ncbi:MAG: polymorphic toxin-type HINT domain-containing protein, partial [archaeon]
IYTDFGKTNIKAYPGNNPDSAETLRGLRIIGHAGILDECLTSKTRLQTPNGLKEIQSIKQGDLVKSYNINKGIIENKKVIKTKKREIKQRELVYLSLTNKGYSIKCTKNHPLYDKNFNIVYADDVKVGDELICFNNKNGNSYNKIQLDIIKGIMMGDGSFNLEKKYKQSVNIKITHSIKQNEYLEHLKDVLNMKDSTKLYKTSFGGEVKSIVSKNLKSLKKIYNQLYINGKKTITKNYLNSLNEISLAYWFMDDGNISNKNIQLSTHGFSYEENYIIKNWFYEKYNINPKIIQEKRKNNMFYIVLNREDSRKFCKLISKYIIPSMRYKLKNMVDLDEYQKLNIEHLNYKTVFVKDKKYVTQKGRVYNIEVEDNHNYMIEGMGTLSHNCNFMRYYKSLYQALRDTTEGVIKGKEIHQFDIGTTLKGETPFSQWLENIEKGQEEGNVMVFDFPVYQRSIFEKYYDNDPTNEIPFYQNSELIPLVTWQTNEVLWKKYVEDPHTFKEEYMAYKVDSEEQFYPTSLIFSVMEDMENKLENIDFSLYKRVRMGIDPATVSDYFAVSIFVDNGEHWIQKYLDYVKNTNLPVMQRYMENILNKISSQNKEYLCTIDSTPIGLQTTQYLQSKFNNVRGVTGNKIIKDRFKNTYKLNEYGHSMLRALMQKGEIKLIEDEIQIKHFQSITYEYKPSKTSDGHGDTTMACLYALLPQNLKSADSRELRTNLYEEQEEKSKQDEHDNDFLTKLKGYRRKNRIKNKDKYTF